jgi:hypothetical protein
MWEYEADESYQMQMRSLHHTCSALEVLRSQIPVEERLRPQWYWWTESPIIASLETLPQRLLGKIEDHCVASELPKKAVWLAQIRSCGLTLCGLEKVAANYLLVMASEYSWARDGLMIWGDRFWQKQLVLSQSRRDSAQKTEVWWKGCFRHVSLNGWG